MFCWFYLRFHVEHVLNRHAFSVLVPLVQQLVFGPRHVDVLGRGAGRFVVARRVSCRVPVVNQLGLSDTQEIEICVTGIINQMVPWNNLHRSTYKYGDKKTEDHLYMCV